MINHIDHICNIGYVRNRLRGYIRPFVQEKEITLRSGKKSNFYIDCRPVILNGVTAQAVAELMMIQCSLLSSDASYVAATGVGGSHISAGIVAASRGHYSTLHVRSEAKTHGLKNKIEGPTVRGAKTIVVDDVLTTGNSLETCIKALKKEGHQAVGCVVLVDRGDGGKEYIEKTYNIPVVSVFHRGEFIKETY